ncbi:LysR family transcriptional regulator [Enterobacteriaceae bacterium H11S18]|uniref:LysR family transcriptional regulator n=1 Tax=Dryocola clanedunensis TaxID=2925396 RepID=UPI0022F0579D|nr:LysR family transcriptional regulator [Dryocola clanedunensis]MCT4711311.1 LysR family transcriptional regulator [Dryocola clanedunensis]
MDSKDFDLNSLLILHAVIECGSVTAAAKKMAMSPSSVTYAINKIRRSTMNPIFTRTKNGITPTTLALELNQRYTKAIALINDGLEFSSGCKESEVSRNIIISTYNFFEYWLCHYVTNTENRISNFCLNFVDYPISRETRISKLRNHEVDFDIGGLLPNDASIVAHKLCSSRFKALVSINHPTIHDKLTLDDWNKNKHIKWMQKSDEAMVHDGDANLVDELHNRVVAVKSTNSLNSLMICSESDYIMLVPEYLADFLKENFSVKVFDLPFETTMTSALYVHFHRSAKRKEFVNASLDTLINMVSENNKSNSSLKTETI